MRTKHTVLAWLVALVVAVGWIPQALAIDKQEIITLAQLGIGGEEIIKAIEKDRTIFRLAVDDILELKQAGVPEDVIRFMLETPRKFGGETVDTPAVGPEGPEVYVDQPVVEKTPEEIRAEAERARIEAERLKAEQDKVASEQRKRYMEGRLRDGLKLAEEGKYLEALAQFQKTLDEGEFAPGSDGHYVARYGMALAAVKGGMLRSAADLLLETVLAGPDKPYFQAAFLELRRIRKLISYSPPNLEQFTSFFVGNMPRAFQDTYNYMLGEFFLEGANPALALRYFDEVDRKAPEYASALYLKALIHVANRMYRSAVEGFQGAILAQESNRSDQAVSDLAYLALARIAYELGDYDASVFYYRKVPKKSPQLPVAFYEMGWCYFAKGDVSRALGTFHALHSPFFDHYFYPELWILEATVYLNNCRYEEAKEALEMFRRHVSVLAEPLRQFMQSMRTPAEYYMAVLAIMNGDRTHQVPMDLLKPVLSHMDFYRMHRTVLQVEKEKSEVEKNRARLGRWADEALAILEADRIARMNELGIRVQQILRGVEAELREYEVKVTEIELDLNQVEMEKIEMETQLLMIKEQLDRAVELLVVMVKRNATVEQMIETVRSEDIYKRFTRGQIAELKAGGVPEAVVTEVLSVSGLDRTATGSVAIVGSDSLEWPFEGDYWDDELAGFRSFLKSGCMK